MNYQRVLEFVSGSFEIFLSKLKEFENSLKLPGVLFSISLIIYIPKYVRDKICTTYQKELDLFLEQFPEAQRNHIKYFTNQLTPTSSIEETIAEGGAILNTYNNIPLFSIRSEYLERYFPKTIAQIEKATIHTEPQVLEKIASKQLYDIGSMSKKLNIPDFMNTRNKGAHIA